ncbi:MULTISPECIES: hypothetical protein [unclassified Burkholderia]|uniref:hypothetical protein n=1 Tax=unclassified Burkholderia TaxID=2613784 RepID=UPI002AB2FDD8|nr:MULTISPECIES: hypothetical protein [unclassified Burkholderia]
MSLFELTTHAERGYSPRTRHNARVADLTAAFAFDFETRGELLTHLCAGPSYVALPLTVPPIEAARQLFRALRARNARVLNVAGNSLPTLLKHGVDQDAANAYVFETISIVTRHWRLMRIVSGGQTGIDVAGGVAALALGIDAVLTFPPGFLQRAADGHDHTHTEEEVLASFAQMTRTLADTFRTQDAPAPCAEVESHEHAEMACACA